MIRKYIQFSSREITVESIEAMDGLEKSLEGISPLLTVVSYRTPAARNSDGELERIMSITIYEGTSIVKEETDPGVIKNGVGKLLTPDYYDASDEGTVNSYAQKRIEPFGKHEISQQ